MILLISYGSPVLCPYFPLLNPSVAPMGVLSPCSVSQGAVKAALVQSTGWKFPGNVRVRSELKVQPFDIRMEMIKFDYGLIHYRGTPKD